MWILTKDFHLYNTNEIDLDDLNENMIYEKNENLYRFINIYDFIYTKSEIKEDVGFVCEVTKDSFTVTFSNMVKKVTFRFEDDKKLRLIKEIWKPTNEKTYRKIWCAK